MFKKVLVPLDGSEVAKAILPYVSQLAKGLNIPIVLMSVINPDAVRVPARLRGPHAAVTSPLPGEPGGANAMQYGEAARTRVESHLREEVLKPLEREGLEAKAIAVVGKPEVEIVNTAKNEECDLIAMSTHGRGRLKRTFLGSVTYKVVHLSPIPVLVFNPDMASKYGEEGGTISRIIAPLDGSELAESSLPYVTELAKKFSLEVDLVQVVETIHGYGDEIYSPVYVDMQIDLEKWAADYMGSVAEKLDREGIKSQSNILKGFNVATSIVEFARQTPSDLIVLTTHGYSGFSELVFGGVAEALVIESGDPVLVIPAVEPVQN